MPKFLFRRLQNAQSTEGGGGGGGGTGGTGGTPAPVAITPEIQALIDAAKTEAVNAAVTGLKAKNSELIAKVKDAGEKLKTFDGIDPVAVKAILTKFASEEEAALLAKGEIDTVLTRRTEHMQAAHAKQIAEANAVAERNAKQAQAFQGRVLDESIRAAIAQAGLHKFAIDDALLAARTMFSLNDDGQAVAIGSDGEPVLGKDGKTPLSPLEWLESMNEKKPHWWLANASGGGASQSASGGAVKARAQMTALEKSQYISKHGKDQFLALP